VIQRFRRVDNRIVLHYEMIDARFTRMLNDGLDIERTLPASDMAPLHKLIDQLIDPNPICFRFKIAHNAVTKHRLGYGLYIFDVG
jgi:hypothetical protein